MDLQYEVNLINFFIRNKHLTHKQKGKFKFLLARDLAEIEEKKSSNMSSVEWLLNIWEKEGLDAAVNAWKNNLQESSDKQPAKKKKNSNKTSSGKDKLSESSSPIIPQPDGIDPKDFEVIKAEHEEMKKKIGKEKTESDLSIDFQWDDFSYFEFDEP